jgi:hypothetical protein
MKTYRPLKCELYDYLEIACLYRYTLAIELIDGQRHSPGDHHANLAHKGGVPRGRDRRRSPGDSVGSTARDHAAGEQRPVRSHRAVERWAHDASSVKHLRAGG